MDLRTMVQLGQMAFRAKKGLHTKEDMSRYFKELRKKRKNYPKTYSKLPIDNNDKPL